MCIGEGRIDESRLCRKITNNIVIYIGNFVKVID